MEQIPPDRQVEFDRDTGDGDTSRTTARDSVVDPTAPHHTHTMPLTPLDMRDYTLGKRLGRGGQGEVFIAEQRSLGRRVAVKVLKSSPDESQAVQRFMRESRTLAQIQHPNIVTIHGIGKTASDELFLVMELVEGPDLSKQIAARQFPIDEAVGIMLLISKAIAHAHGRGVIHRDLKPSNVLWDTIRGPVVTDFGLVKDLRAVEALTVTEQIIGTPSYMAPEQVHRKYGEISERTDIYGLAATLFALLTGRPPVEAGPMAEILLQLTDPDPIRASRTLRADIPATLCLICQKGLAKYPAERYATVGEFAAALESWLASPSLKQSLVEQPRAIPAGRTASGRIAPAVVGLLMLGGVAAGVAMWRPWERVAAREQAEAERAEQESQQRASELEEVERLFAAKEFADCEQRITALLGGGTTPAGELWLNRGTCRLELNHLAEAIADLTKAAEALTEDARAFSRLGMAYLRNNDWQAAVDTFGKALALSRDPRDLHSRGIAYQALEQQGAAEADYKEALDLDPDNADARLSLGYLHAEMSDHSAEAIEELTAALMQGATGELLGHAARAFAAGSAGLKSLQAEDESLVQSLEALEANRDDPGVLAKVAWTLATSPEERVRDGKRAIRYATRACDLTDNKDPTSLDALAAAQKEAPEETRAAIQARLKLYQAGQSYRQPTSGTP